MTGTRSRRVERQVAWAHCIHQLSEWSNTAEHVLAKAPGTLNYEVAQVVGAVAPANRWAIHAATSAAVFGPASMCITPG